MIQQFPHVGPAPGACLVYTPLGIRVCPRGIRRERLVIWAIQQDVIFYRRSKRNPFLFKANDCFQRQRHVVISFQQQGCCPRNKLILNPLLIISCLEPEVRTLILVYLSHDHLVRLRVLNPKFVFLIYPDPPIVSMILFETDCHMAFRLKTDTKLHLDKGESEARTHV